MIDPYRVLGVTATADDETIRAAYLTAIRDCPPERDRERFERVRAAYEEISDLRRRVAHALFDVSAPNRDDLLAVIGADFQPGRPDESRLRRLLGGK